MADIKLAYGSKTNVTITVASLADNSMRQSAAIDNGTSLFVDAQVGGFLRTGTGSAAGDYINIYVYGSADDGTTYSGGCSGSDAAYTDSPAGQKDSLRLAERISTEAASSTYQFGPFSVAEHFGGKLPEDWGIVVENQSDSTLDSTGGNHEIHYQGVYATG